MSIPELTEEQIKNILDEAMKKVPYFECKGGKILIDWNNPEHVKFYERWMED